MEELHCILALKETEVRDKCEKLDRYLSEKETEAKDKSEKIDFIEGLCRKKHDEIMALRQ
jgi:hypothetical protein